MILLHCIALWWYYDTVALGSVWSRLKPVWLSLVRAETTRFIFVSPLSDWILATSLTTSLHVSTSLQPQSLTTGKTPKLGPNFPKKGLLWKRDLFKTSVISISVKTQFSEVIKMQVSAWVRSMKTPLCDVEEVEVMAREEDRISIVRGAKSSRGDNFSGSRDAGAGGGRGCRGKWTGGCSFPEF